MVRLTPLCLLIMAAAGCSGNNDDQETVFDDQIQSIEKARGVAEKLQQAADKQRESIEQQDR